MEKSIPDQLSMFAPKISEGSDSAISSPGSEDGATRSGSPDGPTIEKSGPDPAPVNRSAWRDEAKVPPIRAIFGRRGSGSLASDNLQRSLENRLRAQMGSIGSILYSLTWKRADTPSGRSISRLRASALRTDGSGYGSWPTTTVKDAIGSKRHGYMNDGRERAAMNQRRETLTGHAGTTLCDAAELATWKTPTAGHEKKGSGQDPEKRKAGGHTVDLQDQVLLAAWSTPTATQVPETPETKLARDAKHKAEGKLKGVGTPNLHTQAMMASPWPTPNTMEGGQTSRSGDRKDEALMGGIIRGLDRSGPDATGSHAATAKRGRLNPAHSRWLMGYPPEWDACAVTAMPLSPKSRPK